MIWGIKKVLQFFPLMLGMLTRKTLSISFHSLLYNGESDLGNVSSHLPKGSYISGAPPDR